MTKESLIYGRDKLAFITNVEKDGEHINYILYLQEEECFIPIDKGNDLGQLKQRAREEHQKCYIRNRFIRNKVG